jgi:NADPH:quinone reductase-like Zn-dependent oxidoreductase
MASHGWSAAFGLRRPKQPTIGRDVAGEVEAVGAQVTRFRVGDAVYAESNQGGYAEFAAVQERFVALRPTTLDAVHASAVPVSGTTALQGLRLAGVAPGQYILVNGASGGVGGFAVQLAKAMGAEVTGVCRAAKADHVRAIGADHVIDYTSEDFTVGGGRYDVIFDLVADHPSDACVAHSRGMERNRHDDGCSLADRPPQTRGATSQRQEGANYGEFGGLAFCR